MPTIQRTFLKTFIKYKLEVLDEKLMMLDELHPLWLKNGCEK
jgi:hypothetical protein